MKNKMTYDEAKLQLESILNDLQENQLGIDELSMRIKEAVELVDFCKKKLHSVEIEVEKVLKKTDN